MTRRGSAIPNMAVIESDAVPVSSPAHWLCYGGQRTLFGGVPATKATTAAYTAQPCYFKILNAIGSPERPPVIKRRIRQLIGFDGDDQ